MWRENSLSSTHRSFRFCISIDSLLKDCTIIYTLESPHSTQKPLIRPELIIPYILDVISYLLLHIIVQLHPYVIILTI